MPIASLDCDTDIANVVSALRRDGAVIIRNLIETDLVDTVRGELRPELIQIRKTQLPHAPRTHGLEERHWR